MKKEEELLAEVLKLMERFGADTFKELASMLADPEVIRSMALVLSGAPAVAQSLDTKVFGNQDAGESKSKPGVLFLRSLEKEDPKKAMFLEKVRDDILNGRVFRDMYDARQFAEQQGISLGSAKSRKAIITPIIRCLAEHSVKGARDLLVPYDPSDRSLQRFAAVIMGERS